jgi:CubicO group peptidase (beta-lactamase class C family)
VVRPLALRRLPTSRLLVALAVAIAAVAAAATGGSGSVGAGGPVDVTNRWTVSSPAAQGMDGKLLRRGDAFVRAQLPSVTSLLVVRHGRIVFERYYGSSRERLGDVQSVTKSVVSALVGIALAKRHLTGIEQRLASSLPANDLPTGVDPRIHDITIEDLLTMRAGFAGDVVTGHGYTLSSNWPLALLSRKLVRDPGTQFAYDSGTAHLLSALLTAATGMSAEAYARRYLFGPLGLGTVDWQSDPSGISLGGWGLSLNARQMAKLGYLYLHSGRWGGKQIVPTGWVRASTTKRVSTGADPRAGGTSWGYPYATGYGYLWWRYPRARPSGYMAVGRGGQFILVWPKLDLVVVTTALVQDGDWDLRSLLERFVLPAVAQ